MISVPVIVPEQMEMQHISKRSIILVSESYQDHICNVFIANRTIQKRRLWFVEEKKLQVCLILHYMIVPVAFSWSLICF